MNAGPYIVTHGRVLSNVNNVRATLKVVNVTCTVKKQRKKWGRWRFIGYYDNTCLEKY
jgi:hypothetical protein